ncbi:hypothetical protein KY285_034310 [Solanum tuberosum]|nr:hypothetical protein KY289_034519 [Solanum tuberosum]KAH0649062.1 hypothetical protein KY285_034310 [Solanum tuberosum]
MFTRMYMGSGYVHLPWTLTCTRALPRRAKVPPHARFSTCSRVFHGPWTLTWTALLPNLAKAKSTRYLYDQWRPFMGLKASRELASLPIRLSHWFKEVSKGGEGLHLPRILR